VISSSFECQLARKQQIALTPEEAHLTEPLAIVALRKARYFLAEARRAEADPAVLANRLSFGANLEAAIVYARSSLDHLHNEFAPKHNATAYRRWHDAKFKTLRDSDTLFEYFAERRNFIVHQEPEQTNAQVSVDVELSVKMSMSVNLTVTRADGTVEHYEPASNPTPDSSPPKTTTSASQVFLFADKEWRAKPAVAYVDEFINICDGFISEAVKRFE
jgi:hypothetical protein